MDVAKQFSSSKTGEKNENTIQGYTLGIKQYRG